MNVILLAGGTGKRLWPLSDDVCSKQFLEIFKNSDDGYESMLHRIYRKIKQIDSCSSITIATSKSQEKIVKSIIKDDVNISAEPCSRDTFPAIVLAVAYLHYVKNLSLDEVVVVCPVDHYVEDDYYNALHDLWKLANETSVNLSLMGIKPSSASERYGYIIPENENKVSKVKMFKEKPNVEKAKEYIEKYALWNSGIFAFKLKYVLDIAHRVLDFKDYDELLEKYNLLDKTSFDYAVVEKESDMQVMRFDGNWNDIGTWDVLAETINDGIIGNAIIDNNCINTNIINELNIPILCMGMSDVVVVATSNGILISNKQQSDKIKPYVEKILTFKKIDENDVIC